MYVCICDESAVELWRVWRLFGPAGLLEMRIKPSGRFTHSWKSCVVAGETPSFQPPSSQWAARLLEPESVWLSAPVDFYSTDNLHRAASFAVVSHLPSKYLLPGDFVAINQYVFVTTPEASLMAATRELDRPEALRLINEFCGAYVTDAGTGRGFRDAPAITSVEELLGFCDIHLAWKQAREFRQTVRYAVDGCASPAESTMAALLCLPYRDGGYGLPLPTMNAVVELGHRANGLADRGHYVGDAVWSDSKVIVEYDSKAEHTDQARVTHDHIRKLALEADGYHVSVVTPVILANASLFGKVARDTCARLGRRHRPGDDAAGYRAAQRKARESLIDVPNRWYRAWSGRD
jgi:hypothetical protein